MSAWRVLARVVAVCLLGIFVPLTGALLLAFEAQQTLIAADFVEEAFEDTRSFQDAVGEAAEVLAREVPRQPETRHLPIARLDEAGWEAILNALLPADELEAWVSSFTREFRDWVRTGGDWTERVTLPFGDIAARMVDDPDQVVLRTLTEAQPACQAGQSPLASGGLIPSCQPSSADLDAFYAETQALWAAEPAAVWSEFWPGEAGRYAVNTPLAEMLRREAGTDRWELRRGWVWGRWGLGMAGGLLILVTVGQGVLLIGLATLLAARSGPEMLRWAGAPLALAGLFTVGLAVIVLVGASLGSSLAFPFESRFADLNSLTGGLSRAFARDLWVGLSFKGGVMALIGLALWVSSLFIPQSASPVAPPAGSDTAGGADPALSR